MAQGVARSITLADYEQAGDTRRFTVADLPEWGIWLTGRLSERYPGFNAAAWLGKIHTAIAGNDFLFIRNERAVLLIGGAPRFLDGGLVFIEIFAFSRDAVETKDRPPELPYKSPDERPLLLLYRHARAWCATQKATRLFLGQCSDIPPARLKELMGGASCGWVSVKL